MVNMMRIGLSNIYLLRIKNVAVLEGIYQPGAGMGKFWGHDINP